MIERLEFILALARERHFGRAAQFCNVSQQTLSAGVKQLEERLGVMLVQRGSRFQGFTPEGERVLEWARRIVGDTRAMRQEVASLRRGLSGMLRLAAIPTATPIVAALTTPFRAHHPEVRFSVQSKTSGEIGRLLADLEIDAGITYLENEPLGRVTAVPLYRERYRLLTAVDGIFGTRDTVTWEEVGRVPLCLLTPDMQNRRIIDRHLTNVGRASEPLLESNSMIVLLTHVRTAKWASVMPAVLADSFRLSERVRSVPIVEPDVSHVIGLVVPEREPMTPLCASLIVEARAAAPTIADDIASL
ncbi:LysR family transcriptional regulator [Methylobacterium iners]|uniref:HTH-type transcriptional regulator CynR n=1 Tax=Methylobacterium iners TaxID=418707 RepID=A0ABQ4RWD6_9HYPH|nr:LysR family transcriptional regulator [Methylobacterium iners]GJD95168.1 HTH-type transcriptional regulator CynR [Methylobacterium iners]